MSRDLGNFVQSCTLALRSVSDVGFVCFCHLRWSYYVALASLKLTVYTRLAQNTLY